MSNTTPVIVPAETWRVGTIELIAFPVEPQIQRNQQWWQDIAGDEVESRKKQHERIDLGIYQGSSFQLTIDLIRVRWTATTVLRIATANDLPESGPDIGSYNQVLEWFDPVMTQWLERESPPLKRLAFIAKLFHWTDTREESYQYLDGFLHAVDVSPDSREFQYRVNRTRNCATVNELTINRRSTWSSAIIRLDMELAVGSGGNSRQSVNRDFNASMLQIDINTSQDYEGELPHDRLPNIWHELIQLGTEIAERGDIR